MIHPRQDEIRRLVENWAAWAGDQKGAVYSVSPIAWSEMAYAMREANLSRTYVIKSIGADAQLTGDALAAMVPRESRALKVYYLSSITAAMAAREYLRCSERTYRTLVSGAHSSFWNLYCTRKDHAASTSEQLRALAESCRP